MLVTQLDHKHALDGARRDLRERKYAEALCLIREAMRTNMGSPETHNLLGVYYELRGDAESARKHYRAACVFDPSYLPALNNLERLVTWRFVRDPFEFDLGEKSCCTKS